MIFYKRFLGDYGTDTGHLTLAEHGAYTLMLDNLYATEKPLPAEKKALYRLLRAETESEKRAVDHVAEQYFEQLPVDRETLFAALGFHTDEDRGLLLQVATDAWFKAGGLINTRSLREIVKAHAIAEKNRQTAILREEKRRAYAAGGQS